MSTETGPRHDVEQQLRRQAEHCRPASPLTHRLLTGAADDLAAGGVSARVLAGSLDDPPGTVVGLRLAGALHRLVLRRLAPALALHYPSVGGRTGTDTLWPVARAAMVEHTALLRTWVEATPVQTNEIGRSSPLWGGLQVAAQRAGGLGVRLLEVGASAGLNLRPDRVGLRVGERTLGDAGSPLQLDAGWTSLPPADLDAPLRVVSRAGCDPYPVDAASTDGREHLSSFVWADDSPRWTRLRAALALARREPVAVAPLSGADFLARELAEPGPGTLTVVWHSVVWQYVGRAERQRAREVMAEAAGRASTGAPLALLVYESVRVGHGHRFELRLRQWPQHPEPLTLGSGHGHGIPFSWT